MISGRCKSSKADEDDERQKQAAGDDSEMR